MPMTRGAFNPRRIQMEPQESHRTATYNRRDKFIQLMHDRTAKLDLAFSQVRKLSNKETYPHTEEDRERLRRFLEVEVNATMQSFQIGHEVSGGLLLSRDDTG